ncbi:MAG: chitobiase/beta-hexosaminidase C-terminal domain-containing protein [Candidatus Cloacimonas sp.]|nr:chitobiase/beta-hexosaminidase C-terminal domain-containing protein [Candidatus Cloacimonadota bacterium]
MLKRYYLLSLLLLIVGASWSLTVEHPGDIIDNAKHLFKLPPIQYYSPDSLSCEIGYDYLKLSWTIEENENIDPELFELLGFYIYQSYNQGAFDYINDKYVVDTDYILHISEPGNYSFYVAAAYRLMNDYFETGQIDTVSVTINPPVSNPTFSPPAGHYTYPVKIELSSTEGATIFYTNDTREPTPSAILYVQPIVAEESFVLKARAYRKGYLPSKISMGGYILDQSKVNDKWHEIESHNLKVYPNPFSFHSATGTKNSSLFIEYNSIDNTTPSSLIIYNIKGELVKQFDLTAQRASELSHQWDFRDDNGGELPNGIYFIRLLTNKKSLLKKVILLK